jgi:hypothetical protein
MLFGGDKRVLKNGDIIMGGDALFKVRLFEKKVIGF